MTKKKDKLLSFFDMLFVGVLTASVCYASFEWFRLIAVSGFDLVADAITFLLFSIYVYGGVRLFKLRGKK